MVYGYARIANPETASDGAFDTQVEFLLDHGAEVVYKEFGSGLGELPVLKSVLNKLKKGDKLVVRGLSRLTRDFSTCHAILQESDRKGVDFYSPDLWWDRNGSPSSYEEATNPDPEAFKRLLVELSDRWKRLKEKAHHKEKQIWS